ncbi:hypothetical protein JYU19_01270 [bacterium AH-315-J21]|nr:hypothetical protein [bacterium AH-315-J21]
MERTKITPTLAKRHERCAYIRCCYLADALNCYGFKADCALYLRSNKQGLSGPDFDRAMNSLIDKVRAEDQNLDLK